jgi:hypothetical protein
LRSPNRCSTSGASGAGSFAGWPTEGELLDLAALSVRDERLGAKWFYQEANRFCGWLAGIAGLTPEQAAGVVAALSPRNHWDANQRDAIALSLGAEPRAGSFFGAMPRDVRLAERILSGEPIDAVIRGPKVTAFYRNLTRPDEDVGIPIDRHLGRALWGFDVSDADLSRRASTEYGAAEAAFSRAGAAVGLRPIEFANRVWFVMRRLARDRRQHGLETLRVRWRPFYPGGEYRLSRAFSPRLNLIPGCPERPWLFDLPLPGPRFGNETRDDRGRVKVNLSRGHRFANLGGWQWRARLLAAYALGSPPRPDEHTDHVNGVVDDDRLENLRLLYVEFHGSFHAYAREVAGYRAADGRFLFHEDSGVIEATGHWVNRYGPVVSTREVRADFRPLARTLRDSVITSAQVA